MSGGAGAATGWRRRAVAVPVLALAGCVTTWEDVSPGMGQALPAFGAPPTRPSFAVPVSIPFAAADAGPEHAQIAEFYRRVLLRLQTAAKERDAAQLEALLANYERDDLPADLRERVAGYRTVLHGLRFAQEAAQRAAIVERTVPGEAWVRERGVPALGAPLRLLLQFPLPGWFLGAGTDGEPVGFQLVVRIDDAFVDGSTRAAESEECVRAPLRAGADGVFRLPIDVDLAPAGAVRRDVFVRVDLMPGYVGAKSERLPVPQTRLASFAATQWPVGYAAVADAPLAELRRALQNFGPATFARGWLAAAATSGDEREQAIDALIDMVRFGQGDQAQVAMAALREITGRGLPVGDREAWLAWHGQRR